MIPRYIGAQVILARESWSDILGEINDYWDEDYFITDFDYGEGHYVVVLSKISEWNGQVIYFGSQFPEDKVDEGWANGYRITNVMHDGTDWIVIMSGVPSCINQRWITDTDWDSFKRKVERAWRDGMIVTKIACDLTYPAVYCAVTSDVGIPQKQGLKYFPGRPTADMIDMCDHETVLIDMYDVDGGILALTASETGYDDQRLKVASSWRSAMEFVNRGWDDRYSLTSLCYYQGYWIVAMSY